MFKFKKQQVSPQVHFIFDGVSYKWSGWYGCQLESYEYFRVPAGTQRVLSFDLDTKRIELTVFSTERNWFKVRTTWAVSNRGSLDEHNARILELRAALTKLI